MVSPLRDARSGRSPAFEQLLRCHAASQSSPWKRTGNGRALGSAGLYCTGLCRSQQVPDAAAGTKARQLFFPIRPENTYRASCTASSGSPARGRALVSREAALGAAPTPAGLVLHRFPGPRLLPTSLVHPPRSLLVQSERSERGFRQLGLEEAGSAVSTTRNRHSQSRADRLPGFL